MNTNKNRLILFPHSFIYSKMFLPGSKLFISCKIKVAPFGWQFNVYIFFYKAFIFYTVTNKIFNGNYFQVKTLGNFYKIRQTSHRSVFMHNFNKDSRRLKS